LHESLEPGRAALVLGGNGAAEIGEALLYRWIVQCLVERAGELVDDLLRHAFRREDAGPDAHLIVDAELLGGRHVRQGGEALAGRYRVGLDRAGRDLPGHADRLLAEEVDMA